MALRILSYNILAGEEGRLPQLIRVIQHQRPDVVALLEARSRPHVEVLARALKMELVCGEANNGRDHVAWLSRLPIVRAKDHRVPIFAKTLLEIEIVADGVPLALFATHLKAGRDQKKEQRRVAEVQAILDILQTRSSQPHLLVGDFNALHPQDQPDATVYLATEPAEQGDDLHDTQRRRALLRLLSVGYVDCYRALHPAEAGYTYKLPTPGLRLDYIFASPDLAQRLAACDILTGGEAETASDHYPIWAEFLSEIALYPPVKKAS
ncbi:MAG: endonuclease/exonuclease/phosphatase family protein [Ktedonobacteraceae bacterium]